MSEQEPCRICAAPVRIERGEAPRRLGQREPQIEETRVCTSPSCPSRTGTRKLGQKV